MGFMRRTVLGAPSAAPRLEYGEELSPAWSSKEDPYNQGTPFGRSTKAWIGFDAAPSRYDGFLAVVFILACFAAQSDIPYALPVVIVSGGLGVIQLAVRSSYLWVFLTVVGFGLLSFFDIGCWLLGRPTIDWDGMGGDTTDYRSAVLKPDKQGSLAELTPIEIVAWTMFVVALVSEWGWWLLASTCVLVIGGILHHPLKLRSNGQAHGIKPTYWRL
jgi:hypothetical protein